MILNVIFLSVIFAKRTSSEETMVRELIKTNFFFKGILFKRSLS